VRKNGKTLLQWLAATLKITASSAARPRFASDDGCAQLLAPSFPPLPRGVCRVADPLDSPYTAGCNPGPAVGTVKGQITLDGQAVDGGLIRLVPTDGNSQPADCIITAGAYSITMPVGEKRVEVYWTKTNAAGKVDTASQGTERVITLVPTKYNTESKLTHTVEKGQAVQDFALSSR
jgi:hypothetical protein